MPFDVDAIRAPFRMRPGLRRIDAGVPSLTPNDIGSRHLAAKCAVLRDHGDAALPALQGVDEHAVLRALSTMCPAGLRCNPEDGALTAPGLGWSVSGDDVHGDGPAVLGDCLHGLAPRRRAAGLASLAFAEDLAVLDGATTRVPWLAVCLPSGWSPAEALGLPLARIHAPVADHATLLAASDALVRLVTAGSCWERFVWTVTPHAALDGHPRRRGTASWPNEANADALAGAAFLRSERQAFVPLAGRPGHALFTIHVDVVPLVAAVDTPDRARRLHDAVASMSDAVLAYKGLHPARDRLLDWLADQAR